MVTLPFHPALGPIVVIVIEKTKPHFRSLAAEVLAEAGFTVVEAAHADDALSVMKSRVVDVLFTDVQMLDRWMVSNWRATCGVTGLGSRC